MNYIIELMDKEKIKITIDEFKKMANVDKKGLFFIPSQGEMVNLSMAKRVYPDDEKHRLEARKTQNYGRLHDGLKVIKEFGIWKLAEDNSVRIDPYYYPEVAKDTVMTEEEWCEKIKKIEQEKLKIDEQKTPEEKNRIDKKFIDLKKQIDVFKKNF